MSLRLFDRLSLDGAYLEDRHKDTLLYAGRLEVAVNDFFFLKAKTDFRRIYLKDAVVNLRRHKGDSTWNYQFLLDVFASPDTSGSQPPPNLALRRLSLENVRLNKTDAWLGQDMFADIGTLQLDARSLDLRKHRLLIHTLKLDHPVFVIADYTGSRPPRPAAAASPGTAPEADSSGALRWNPDHWDIRVDKLELAKGAFALIKKEQPKLNSGFDPAHIAVYDINASFDDLHLRDDSIITGVSLSAKERCGLRIDQLKSRFKLSPVQMEFADLDLRTNRSRLRDYYSMNFSDFSDMSDYVSSVIMRANIKNSVISSDDIAYFAPALSTWKKDFTVNGNADGTVENLSGTFSEIRSGDSRLRGRIKMRGLPDINETFIDFHADELLTNGPDIQRFFSAVQEQQTIDPSLLSSIRFEGNFTGFIHDFVAYGKFNTNLGNLQSDLNMKFGKNNRAVVYSGNLSADRFDVGKLFHIARAGAASFNAKLDGQGFDFNTLNARVDANISQLELNDYTYEGISTAGTFNRKLFNGSLAVADPNLDLNFEGAIDFNDSLPIFNFRSLINRSNLYALHLTRDTVTFSGRLNLDFTGNNIDNFLGTARLREISLYKNSNRVEIDSLSLHSDVVNGEKQLTLAGNEIAGTLRGRFNIQHLPDAVGSLLNRYFPHKIKKPEGPLLPENFSFTLSLGKVEKMLQAVSGRFSGLNDSYIRGNINTGSDSLTLTASVPSFGYDRYLFKDIEISGRGTDSMLGLTTTMQGVYVGDSLFLPNARIRTVSHADTSYINFRTKSNTSGNNADIYARLITPEDGYKVSILNSELLINNKDWHIPSDNEIILQKRSVSVSNFNIFHNDQKISLSSEKTDSGAAPAFLVNVQQVNIRDFTRFFSGDNRLEGTVNGQFRVLDPLNKLQISGGLKADRFRINNDSIGLLETRAAYDKEKGELEWSVEKQDDPARNFSMKGLVGLTADNKQLKGEFNLNHTDISLLGSFLGDYVSEFSGTGTGQLSLGGNTESPLLLGKVRMDSVRLKVNYLGTYYRFTNETITFTDNAIDAGSLTLHDDMGHTAVLTGKATHQHFKNLRFDFSVLGSNFRFLNTTEKDNPLYYGQVFASGRLHFYGPLNNMQMDVTVAPQKNTHLYLPLSDAKDIGKHDFIIFQQLGKEMKSTQSGNAVKTNLTVHLNAVMNPNATIDVIVDPNSGDRISARGNGSLQMNVRVGGDFSLYGNYVIESGFYNFSFHNLLNRKFQINEGGTITWSGDPSDANVNITAVYHVPGGATLYDLIAADMEVSGSTINPTPQDRQREKVDVLLNLKGSLKKPDITYDIQLPESGISTSVFATAKLVQIRQNPNDLLTQVTGLLFAGQFIPSASATSGGVLRAGGLSNAGMWVSSQLNGVLNNVFGRQLRNAGVDLNFNYNTYSGTAGGEQGDPLQRNDVQLNVGKSFFNNRVRVEVGPSIDWGRYNNTANNQIGSNSYFAGDFRLEYLISPDGHFRFFAFSRNNYDVLRNQSLTRNGVGMAYRREFDALDEFFVSRREQRYQDSIRAQRFRELQEKAMQEDTSHIDSIRQAARPDSLQPSTKPPGGLRTSPILFKDSLPGTQQAPPADTAAAQ
ncbi:translocation/assembly module TamB domain-containing protein [Compostibacter hankyongensis]|uniref:Translocation/assembly module TamB domain-containing protein n=1 Tax=Compostibacter hankyongensis TaxID=1007089 RepID=A0ABP8FSF2_9BACT